MNTQSMPLRRIPPGIRYQPQSRSTSVLGNNKRETIEYRQETEPQDVIVVKTLLMKAGKLPVELANMILDCAEYWACSVNTINYATSSSRVLRVPSGAPNEDLFVIRANPVGFTSWLPDDLDAWKTQSVAEQLQEENSGVALRAFSDSDDLFLEHPCRKIVFNIRSHDQGWGGGYNDKGKFDGSWTWFEVGLERFEAVNTPDEDDATKESSDKPAALPVSALRPILPPLVADHNGKLKYKHDMLPLPDRKIQCNRIAISNMQDHHVEWRWTDSIEPESSDGDALNKQFGRGSATGDGKFVRNLKFGDVVTIWAKARFPGWTNHIERVEVRIYWAV